MALVSERFDDLGADGAPVKLGIMGGTFDPIHNGHLNMAAEVAEQLGLDAVLFVPAGTPVFKRGQEVTSADDRLEMCRRAIACNPRFDVSAIEIERGGDTYTVDTLRQMREHYPDNVSFYLITGSDTASTIGMWRGSRVIAKLAKLVAVERPDFELDESQLFGIAQAGFEDVACVQTTNLAISSSDIRRRIREGREARYLVPPAAWRFITENGLYGAVPAEAAERSARAEGEVAERGVPEGRGGEDAPEGTLWTPSSLHSGGERSARAEGKVAERGVPEGASKPLTDPLSDEFLAARFADLRQRVSAKRLAHIQGVADTCVELARTYGVDERLARLAGLLHDWDKGLTDEGMRERVHELGLEGELDPWVVENMPWVLHGQTAACALARQWPQIPGEVLTAIERHTVASTEMGTLDKILYVADAIEPSRQFGRIDELRALVGTATLDELYFATYEYWVFLLFERRRPLHPDTIRIWNDFAVKRAAAKGKK